MPKPKDRRAHKNSRFGRLNQVLDPRTLEDGNVLRLYECLDQEKRQGDVPYQVGLRKENGNERYLVAHPPYYDRSELEGFFFSIDSEEFFNETSAMLKKNYRPVGKEEFLDGLSVFADHRDLKVERAVGKEESGVDEPIDFPEEAEFGEDPFADAEAMLNRDD